jgi:hypothetical protein
VATRWLVPTLLAVAVLAGCGSEGRDAPSGTKEKDERMTTAALARAADLKFSDYDPARVVEAVNELQPLGKDAALERVEALLGDRDPQKPAYGVLWVLRVLFEVPDGAGFPPVRIGQPTVTPPRDPASLPRFPIVLAGDVPLLAVRGYTLGGLAEPVDVHVDYYREHGTLRAAPLSPSPENAEDEFMRQWKAAYGDSYPDEGPKVAREQLVRMSG